MGLLIKPKQFGAKITTLAAVFALALQPIYSLATSSVVEAVSSGAITTEQQLLDAAANPSVTVLSIKANITVSQKISLSGRNVTIDGNGHTLTFTGDTSGWQGNYILQAYKNVVEIKHLKLTGADAALLVNGATVNLKGNVDVSGNEFGGIEVSQGSGVTTPAVLNASSVNLTNATEATAKPTAWIDHASTANATVNGAFTKTTHIGTDQEQYYLSAVNANIAVTNTTTGETFASIKAAVQDADTTNGDTLEVAKSLTVTDATTVNKDVTIRGINGAVISTSGNTQLFTITANGVTIEHLTFIKTDNADQYFIGVQADDVTISANQFSAQYNLAANAGTTRALVVSNGADNLVVDGNSFTNIRQPAYLNNSATGTISNNYANQTRGWVVEKNTNFTFTGNSWGTNAVDIAIIPGSNTALANNYTCRLAAIQYANNNARIDDQSPATSCADTTAPTFAIETPANGSVVSGTITIQARIADESGMKKVLMTVPTKTGNKTYTWELGKASNSLTRTGDLYSVTVDTTTLNDGPAHVVLRATDGANNTRYWNNNAANRQHVFMVDNADHVAPTVPVITAPTAGQEFDSDVRSIIATWNASTDASGIKQYEISYEYTRNGVRVTDTRLVNGTSRTQSLSGNVLSDFVIKVRAQDNAGNWSDWSEPVTYYYGVSAPTTGNGETDPGEGTEGGNTGGTPNDGEPGGTTNVPGVAPTGSEQNVIQQLFSLQPAGTTAQLFAAAVDNNEDVLGATTDKNNSSANKNKGSESILGATANPEVMGAATAGLLGLAWYWWVAIATAVVGLGWWFLAALRRRNADDV